MIGLIIWLAAMVSGAVSAVAGPLGSAFQDGFEEGYYGGPSDPLETGAPGAQFAAEPVVCPGVCLTNTGAHFAALTVATTGRFGMSEQSMTDGDVPAFTSETAFNDALASWSGNNRQCVFVNTWVPVFVSYDGALSERATVDLLGQWSDADALSTVTVGTAVFPDSAAAEAHIGRTADAIAGCDFYQVGDPEGGQVDVEVNPAPAVANLHPTIAAVGWIESGPYDRYYVTELQRGEIVVRVTVQTYGGLTQPDAQLLTGMVANRFAEEPLLHG
ncbi:MAG: hypothetical protein J7484_14700 [Microbacterium sp.]|nr:hypothetical protein [Microbacterium sp.]